MLEGAAEPLRRLQIRGGEGGDAGVIEQLDGNDGSARGGRPIGGRRVGEGGRDAAGGGLRRCLHQGEKGGGGGNSGRLLQSWTALAAQDQKRRGDAIAPHVLLKFCCRCRYHRARR
jgi:hypothetical protein